MIAGVALAVAGAEGAVWTAAGVVWVGVFEALAAAMLGVGITLGIGAAIDVG